MSSQSGPSLSIKSVDAPFVPVPAAANGSATEKETKNNDSYFSGPAIAAAFASVARAIINVFTSIGAWLYGAAQSFGFFQDTNAETSSAASTPAGSGVAGLENPSKESSSYGSLQELMTPDKAHTTAPTPTTPATPTALTKNDSDSSLDSANNNLFKDVDSNQEENAGDARPRSDSQNSQSSHMSNGR